MMEQQTELMRQQTEALRQQNRHNRQSEQQPEQTGPTWLPEIGARNPYIQYMSLEARRGLLTTMPKPTGNAKRDERAWNK